MTETPSHRAELRFSDGIASLAIHHPDSGCPTRCPSCNAELDIADSERCEFCEEVDVGECWLSAWESVPPEDLLLGELEFPVAVGFEDGAAVLRIGSDG